MWQPALAAVFLLLGQVSAGVISDAGIIVRRESVEESMRRYVDDIVEPIKRRQSTPNNTLSVAQWDAQTMAACTTALEALNGKASNDAGMAVCYNIPSLDNQTGVFQADLRLFTISAPTGKFANIPSQNVTVGLAYNGATVSETNGTTVAKRTEGEHSLISWPRNKRATVPTMAQAYSFVGRINQDLLSPNMDTSALEKLLIPTVTLTGTDSTGLQVNTTLASGEATFVSGVFAQTATVSKTAVQSPIQTLVVASNAPFVVPGLHILIFPIGGIITGVWAVLLISAIGYGTFGRMQFRESYRRRAARSEKGGQARI